MNQGKGKRERGKLLPFSLLLLPFYLPVSLYATVAESYDPSWASDLIWAQGTLYNGPEGSRAWLEDYHFPWWETRIVNPVHDYDASKLAVGVYRIDLATDFELTTHQLQPGWTVTQSPSRINNVYTFTPGSTAQDKRTTRFGQNAFTDFGYHPFSNLSADIGVEWIGNYDQRYWFPINEEHRTFKDDKHATIEHAQIKYDDGTFLARAFEGIPLTTWVRQNDLFQLLPNRYETSDTERFRRDEGTLTTRGGEVAMKGDWGALDLLGGSEIRWGYGSSVFAKYDFPKIGGWEHSIVFRNENVPFVLDQTDARRWDVSWNTSVAPLEQWQTHVGILYQPYRLGQTYSDADPVAPGTGTGGSNYQISQHQTGQADAFGFLWQNEYEPPRWLDKIGLGYLYLGPAAGDKHQVDLSTDKTLSHDWWLRSNYMYRQPVRGPVPLLFQGTGSNTPPDPTLSGALISGPRGPDDPFRVEWDNRKAHLLSLTLVYDPTPATPFFKYEKSILEEANLDEKEDAEWTGAIQARLAYYPTNADRLYYWNEDRTLLFDPIFHVGALSSSYPYYSGTGLVHWNREDWSVVYDFSAGESPAGLGLAYTPLTNFYKPTTLFITSGLSVHHKAARAFVRYQQDVWGQEDYQIQEGWAYHKVYSAGCSYDIHAFQLGFRYTGTRMTDEFIGADTGAFDEYTLYLTYHFTFERTIHPTIGKKLPPVLPEAQLTTSAPSFTPDGSGPVRTIQLYPKAQSQAGILSWRLTLKNPQGDVAKQWDGNGFPPDHLTWEGLDAQGHPLPPAVYLATLNVADLYGNDVTPPAVPVEIQTHGAATAPAAPMPLPATNKNFEVTQTSQGLKVTLSARVLFDFDKFNLKPGAKKALDSVLGILKDYPDNKLVISGHTDARGGSAYNLALSERRAKSVADYLVKTGHLDPARIQNVGYGKTKPVAPNTSPEGRQRNRRVEIDILNTTGGTTHATTQ